MADVIMEGECCADCLIVMANGDYSGMSETKAAMVNRGLDALEGYAAPSCGEDCEGAHFSWAPCDCCGEYLGGDRHAFIVLSR